MKSDSWIRALHTVKVLCAIDKQAQEDYIQGMYDELKDRFTDDSVVAAARSIAEKEELYGNYPSLRVWLKYCPAIKELKAKNDKKKTEFIDLVSAVMWLDHILYDESEMRKKILALGWRAYNAFQHAGISMKTLRGYNHANETQKNQVLEKFGKCWDEVDDKDPRAKTVPQVMTAKPVLLEQRLKEGQTDTTPIGINQVFEQAELFFEQ